MKAYLKPTTVNAVRWKGWPHKLKNLVDHPKYPQMASLEKGHDWVEDVEAGDWIITEPNGNQSVMDDFRFKENYEIKPRRNRRKD